VAHYDVQNTRAGAADVDRPVLEDLADEMVADEAAAVLHRTELEATATDLPEPNPAAISPADLERLSIDELRTLARALDVPGRSQITEQQELIDAIRRHLHHAK
jgi:hypothetical protein